MAVHTRTSFSLSPLHLLVSKLAVTLKKVVPHSVATDLANIVLPVPGGPVIKTPFQGRRIPWKKSGIHRGSTMASSSKALASRKPAISLHLTLGDVFRMSFFTNSMRSFS